MKGKRKDHQNKVKKQDRWNWIKSILTSHWILDNFLLGLWGMLHMVLKIGKLIIQCFKWFVNQSWTVSHFYAM